MGFKKFDHSQLDRVSKESALSFEVNEFKFNSIARETKKNYEKTKIELGSFAATDSQKSKKSQKDRRFALNPMLKEALGVNEEESRVLEEKVEGRLKKLEEEIRVKSSQAGYEQGFDQGFKDAQEQMDRNWAPRLEQMDVLLNTFDEIKMNLFHENERLFFELLSSLVKDVCLREVKLDPKYYLKLASELLSRFESRDHIQLVFNPKEFELLEVLKTELKVQFPDLKNIKIGFSNQVEEGGILVETDWNQIDARLERQIEEIRRTLISQESVENVN